MKFRLSKLHLPRSPGIAGACDSDMSYLHIWSADSRPVFSCLAAMFAAFCQDWAIRRFCVDMVETGHLTLSTYNVKGGLL